MALVPKTQVLPYQTARLARTKISSLMRKLHGRVLALLREARDYHEMAARVGVKLVHRERGCLPKEVVWALNAQTEASHCPPPPLAFTHNQKENVCLTCAAAGHDNCDHSVGPRKSRGPHLFHRLVPTS